jgi:hypothetical protein
MKPRDDFMTPFPILAKLSGERFQLWKTSLTKEIGSDLEQLQSYLPLWLKKNSKAQGLPEFWTDLADYEWSRYWVKTVAATSSRRSKIQLNPFVRVLRLTFDIPAWIESSLETAPAKRAHVVLISNCGQLEANFEAAAIIDELEEKSQSEDELLARLNQKHGPREWRGELNRLARVEIISRL